MFTVHHTNIYKVYEYSQHLKSLSDADKQFRFGYAASSHSIDELILSMCYKPHLHEMWYAALDDQRIGWGHMAKNPDDSWEIAISVDSNHRNKGIADSLLKEMISWAKFHKITSIYMHCVTDNKVIQHLAVKNGLQTKSKSMNEISAAMDVPEPNLYDLNNQWWKQHESIFSEYKKTNRKLLNLWSNPLNRKN